MLVLLFELKFLLFDYVIMEEQILVAGLPQPPKEKKTVSVVNVDTGTIFGTRRKKDLFSMSNLTFMYYVIYTLVLLHGYYLPWSPSSGH